jgi:transcriptional regulator with XRE-family HTH domain
MLAINMERDNLLKLFGSRLRELRTSRGLSQDALATCCGLDRTYVSGLERGVRNPSLTCIFRVAKGLDVKAEHLIDGYTLEYEK